MRNNSFLKSSQAVVGTALQGVGGSSSLGVTQSCGDVGSELGVGIP